MRSVIMSLVAAGILGVAGVAKADIISVTYGAAGVQSASSVVVANATQIGSESFDNRSNGGFTTDYGTGGVISGTYSSDAVVTPADVYGGAGGVGSYVEAVGGTNGYTISFSTNGVPGINYFGYWLSALDPGNQIEFKRSGVTVGTYQPSDLVAALGACAATNPYCGNPNAAFAGQNSGQPYAFVNFVDTNGLFDQISVTESPAIGNYESDNHTVAYCSNATACITGTNVPEPISIALLGTSLVALGTVARRSRRG